MRIVRIWLLVLLAVLMPLRGVAAAAMLCPNESAPMHRHQHAPAATAHRAMSHDHATPMALHQGDTEGHRHPGGSGHGDKCNLCASCCTGAAMAATFAPVFTPLATGGESFDAPAAPAMRFLSDGQERPPRSI